jgi:hypothetical protein
MSIFARSPSTPSPVSIPRSAARDVDLDADLDHEGDQMTAAELEQSALSGSDMPTGLSPARQALWLARAGRWHDAHEQCQNIPGAAGSWVHAHLHRQEGDHGNAAYWYARAGKATPASSVTLAEEWADLAGEFLKPH